MPNAIRVASTIGYEYMPVEIAGKAWYNSKIEERGDRQMLTTYNMLDRIFNGQIQTGLVAGFQ